jgi:hypothetical protein
MRTLRKAGGAGSEDDRPVRPGDDHPVSVIQVGEYTFRIINYLKDTKYRLVVITSEPTENHNDDGDMTTFAAYKSISCTFWRFAVSFNRSWYKGEDYVQTTMLHMDLQQYIETYVASHDDDAIVFEEGVINHESVIPFSWSKTTPIFAEREVRNKYFSPLVDGFASGYSLGTKNGTPLSVCVDNMTESIIKQDYQETIMQGPYGELVDRVTKLYPGMETHIMGRWVNDQGPRTITENELCDIIILVNSFMAATFDLVQVVDTGFKKIVEWARGRNKLKCGATIMRMRIKEKLNEQPQEFDVYFMVLRCKTTPRPGEREAGVNIFLVIPASDYTRENCDNITKYGLYKQYVPAGLYSSKAMEYQDQSMYCNENRCQAAPSYNMLFNVLRLWPFNLLNEYSFSKQCDKQASIRASVGGTHRRKPNNPRRPRRSP